MTPLYVTAILTALCFLSKAKAQNGVTKEFLTNNPTTARGTTLILQVQVSSESGSGRWFRSPLYIPTNRSTTRQNGTIRELELTDINDLDQGFYYFLLAGQVTQGFVTIVPNVINGGWGDWTDWTGPDCRVTCGGSSRTLTKIRACNRPEPQFGGNDCAGASEETRTEDCGTTPCHDTPQRIQDLNNNPIAYRGRSVTLRYIHPQDIGQGNWLKNGITLSNSEKYQLSSSGGTNLLTINNVQDSDADNYIFFKSGVSVVGRLSVVDAPAEGICVGETLRNGVGYRHHPTDCDKYIQCYYKADSDVLAVYRSCPFGFYWNKNTFRCDEYWKVEDCPVEKCDGTCGLGFKIDGSCGSYWSCGPAGPHPVCCPPGYGFHKGRGCRPVIATDDEICPSPYACRDTCPRRPVWTNSNKYEVNAGTQGWVEEDCPDGMYFDIGDCGCVDRDVPCESARNHDFNSNTFGDNVESTAVVSDGTYIVFNNNSRFSIDVRNLPSGVPRVLRFRYRHSGTLVSELASLTDSNGHNTVVIYSDENGLHFSLKAFNNCEDEMMISTLGMPADDFKTVTLWYDGRHITTIVASGIFKNRARIYAPNIVFLENKLRLGSSDSVMRQSTAQTMEATMQTVPFNGWFDYVTIDICDGGLLI